MHVFARRCVCRSSGRLSRFCSRGRSEEIPRCRFRPGILPVADPYPDERYRPARYDRTDAGSRATQDAVAEVAVQKKPPRRLQDHPLVGGRGVEPVLAAVGREAREADLQGHHGTGQPLPPGRPGHLACHPAQGGVQTPLPRDIRLEGVSLEVLLRPCPGTTAAEALPRVGCGSWPPPARPYMLTCRQGWISVTFDEEDRTMLVTFTCPAHADITMFGDIAIRLLKLMGHSGQVPGAILAAEIRPALMRLESAIEADGKQPKGKAPGKGDDDEPAVSLSHRALPLIGLLQAAAQAECDVMWDRNP